MIRFVHRGNNYTQNAVIISLLYELNKCQDLRKMQIAIQASRRGIVGLFSQYHICIVGFLYHL